jgi:hypothetical protein
MSTVRKILGYGWAVLAIPLVLAMFFGLNSWAKLLAQSTGVQVSPWMNGGEIVRTLPHAGYETRIHRPVFDGLLGPRARGFVQVDWVALPPAIRLPDQLEEQIDYDNDGVTDFGIQLDTQANRATLRPRQTNVLGSGRVMVLKDGRVVRVDLKRQP